MLLLATTTVWCVSAVGAFVINVIDNAVLDGSGHAAVARVEALDLDDEPEEAASPTPPKVQPVVLEAVEAQKPTPVAARPVVPLEEVTGEDPAADFHDGRSGTYKTYCVRLCDGYFWPISFSTTADRLEQDAEACNSACGTPARLFVHAIPGGSVATMQSLDGLPYSALKTAFLFRTKFDAQCKCRAHPWEEIARDRHKLMAAESAASSGDAAAKGTVKQLSDKIAKVQAEEEVRKTAASEVAKRDLAKLAAAVGAKPLQVAAPRRASLKVARGQPLSGQPFPGDGTLMRLGGTAKAEAAAVKSTGFRPASGSSLRWEEKAFSGQ
jgi:hypothetical protein